MSAVIRFIECQMEHIQMLKGVYDGNVQYLSQDAYARSILPVTARTMLVDEQVVGCFGAQPMWNGVSHGWTLLTPAALDHGYILTRTIRRCIKFIEERDELHRIQASVTNGFAVGHRWARVLGFRPECKMYRYGPKGEDAWLYARVRHRD